MADSATNVPGRILHSFLRIGAAHGVDAGVVFRRAGVAPDLATLDDVYFTVEEFDRMLEAFAEEAGDPAFGVHLGEMFNLFDLRAVTTLINTSPTLADGAAGFARYRPLFHPLLHVEIRRGAPLAVVAYRPTPGVPCSEKPLYAEFVLAFHLCYARWLVAGPIQVERAELRRPRPKETDEYDRIFGVTAEFGADEDRFLIADEVLSRPLRSGFGALHAQAEALAASELSKVPGGAAVAPRVMRFIRERLAERELDVALAARQLGMSNRTLQRKLRDEGTSFSELRDEVRASVAVELVRDHRLSIDAVAEALGYGERASFTHAFARWTGLTPGAFRRDLGVA